MRNLKLLVPFIILAFLVLLMNYFVEGFQLAWGAKLVVNVVGIALLSWLTFKMAQPYFPQPANLGGADVKSFFSSKMFWLALLNLVAALLSGLFNIELDLETQTEIVNLDWTNIGQALISVGLMVIRRFDVFKFLN